MIIMFYFILFQNIDTKEVALQVILKCIIGKCSVYQITLKLLCKEIVLCWLCLFKLIIHQCSFAQNVMCIYISMYISLH